MKGRRLLTLVGGICLILVLAALPFMTACAAPPAEKIVLKAVTAWPSTTVEAKDFLKFVDKVNTEAEQKYPGELEIQYLGGPEAIPTKDQAEAVRTGTIDMNLTSDAYYAGIAPVVNAMKLTQLTPWEERESGAYDLLNEIHQEQLNCFYLGRLGSDIPFQLYLNVKVEKPADLAELNIRVSPMYIDFMNALGATPVETSPVDVYTAIERGTVDGYCWPAVGIRDWGWEEVTKYVVGPSFYNVVHEVLVNLDTWNRIPGHLQDFLIDTMKESEHEIVAESQELLAAEPAILKEKGLEFIEFSPADTKWYYDLAYSAAWEGITKKAPEDAPKLRELISK
ncbi:MAG: TRAP transporter substrate-binding protein DctP [Dehalococcoidia bacterium]|nr:TRAP transporter substrate-binding protein DctP [Dehalococcoidia bacterium]